MIDLQARDYQKSIFETSEKNNTLVVLPTGLGKTLIGLMLSIARIQKYPSSKVLFLAPTKPLVEQHFEYFKKHLPELFADLQMFTGSVPSEKRKEIWQTAEIIFSTPQCIANDLDHYLYNLKEVSLLIIDEAHRCLKNYDYTKVVGFYKRQTLNERILGLTASPGADISNVRQICSHLNIQEIELRTRDSPDVKQYIKERDFEKVEVPFPKEFIEIKVLLKRIWDEQVEKLQSRGLLRFPANKIILLKLQSQLAMRAMQKDFNAMQGMGLTAKAIKISHAIELLETQTLYSLKEYLDSLQKQADIKQSKAVQSLVSSSDFKAAYFSLMQLMKKEFEHPKVDEITARIESELKENNNAKIILFTQFRDTAHIMSLRISKQPRARTQVFVGQAKKKTTGLSQKEQKQIIEKFKSGEANILICTSIGEEGLDIPEVNAVYFYEPIPSAIRKIQRAGRTARLSPGKLLIFVTKDTKDEIHHYASTAREKKMYKTIELMKNELQAKKKNPSLDSFYDSKSPNSI